MKKLVLAILALSIVLIGCSSPGGTAGNPPKSASVAGAKGLFLQAGAAGRSLATQRTLSGRAIVSASGGELGAIMATGEPTTAAFTDSGGAEVTVTITKAVQLTATYTLIAYSYDGGSGTATLDLSTGALAEVNTVPDNWGLIHATGANAWYVSGGSVYRMTLATGAAVAMSTGSPAWDTNAFGGPATVGAASSWGSSAWVYADAAGNVYAIYCTNSANFMAAAITPSGQVDFGDNPTAWTFLQSLPGTSLKYQSWVALDPASGAVYLIKGTAYGGGTSDVAVYPVTFNPGAAGVISIGAVAASGPVATTVSFMSHIGFGAALVTSIWSTGADTFQVSPAGAISAYNTSAVPVSTYLDGTDRGIGAVTNWVYSGGEVYAGPTTTMSTISLVKFQAAPTVANPVLVNDAGITAWTIVGGVLFYTTGSGTYQATVDAVAGSISTPAIYTGGEVKGITQ